MTYTDEHTVEVQRLPPALLPGPSSEDLGQPPGAVDSQDVDVVLAAESLDESEVDLQGHILHLVLVRGQDAQDHVIRVSAGGSGRFRAGPTPVPLRQTPRDGYSHVERLGSLVHPDGDGALRQRGGQDFLQSFGYRVHSAKHQQLRVSSLTQQRHTRSSWKSARRLRVS